MEDKLTIALAIYTKLMDRYKEPSYTDDAAMAEAWKLADRFTAIGTDIACGDVKF
jgi:hypothetical protein